jgi:hypothetical protein
MSNLLRKLKSFPTGLLILMIGFGLATWNLTEIIKNLSLAPSPQLIPSDVENLVLTLLPADAPELVTDPAANLTIADLRRFELNPSSCPKKVFLMLRDGWFPLLGFETAKAHVTGQSEAMLFWRWLDAKKRMSATDIWSAMTGEALSYYKTIYERIVNMCSQANVQIIAIQRRRDSTCFFEHNIFYSVLMRSIYPKLILEPGQLRQILYTHPQFKNWIGENKARILEVGRIQKASCGWIPDQRLINRFVSQGEVAP